MQFRRPGLGEVAGSLSMLLVTMALLAGASVLALASIKGAVSVITAGLMGEARSVGELVTVISTQSNSSGSYIWLFNYGWEDVPIPSTYVNGSSMAAGGSCAVLKQGSLCALVFPAGTSGVVTLVLGDRSLEVAF